MLTRAREVCVIHRCQNKNPRLGDVNDVMHRKRARRIFGDWKKSVELRSCLGRRQLTFACSRKPCDGCARVGGDRWKSQHRKIVLSLFFLPEKPLNSKVIKSFVPELRSRKCFSCFGIPMFYVYML